VNSTDGATHPTPLDVSTMLLPVAGHVVHAGFPSPADDFLVQRIDLTRELITHPQAQYRAVEAHELFLPSGKDWHPCTGRRKC
jgi:hypothetical protein